MQVSHPELLGNGREIRRQRLSDRLTIRPVVHDAANTLVGHEPQVLFEQLSANVNLGSQLECPYL